MIFALIFAANIVPYRDKSGNKIPGIVSYHSGGEHLIRCDYCFKFPHIVKQFITKKPPGITTEKGTRYYKDVLSHHLSSKYHDECTNAYRISTVGVEQIAPMEIAISRANKQQIDHVGKLMIMVYLDAKRLNLSPNSWPSRYVAGDASHNYNSQNQNAKIVRNNINLQYVNTHGHLSLMTGIVNSHRPELLQKITECLALSLRIDGSIDFTHVDKIYVLAKLINPDGSSELIFIGVSEQTERLAAGLMLAVIEALKTAVDDPKLILNKVSSLSTDGTNVNTGDTSSLWVLMDQELISAGSKIPLLKIWCAAHRAELAWKSTAKTVPETTEILSVLSSISTYFHYSALRTAELKKIASDHELKLLNIPKIFQIRWSQFTYTLLRSVLVSWKALVLYFEKHQDDAQCVGYLEYLTKLDNVKLITFLADVLFMFKRFHKKLQSDRLTLIEMKVHVTAISASLQDMETTPLVGGFENKLSTKITIDSDGKTYFKSIEMHSEGFSRTRRVAENFADVRTNVLVALRTFLTERFQIDEEILKKIEPFVKFEKGVNIEEIHALLAPDLELPSLFLQYQEISSTDIPKDKSLSEIIAQLSKTDSSREIYKELIIVLARIYACTPHSADVERCMSANNLLKTKRRSSISIQTENKYMYIRMNMPVLSEWNPTAAAKMYIEQKAQRIRDVTTGGEVSKRQTFFKGVFNEANQFADDDEDENDNVDGEDNFFEF